MPRDSDAFDERFAAYVRECGERPLRVAALLTGDWHAAEDRAAHHDHVRGLRAPGLGQPTARQRDLDPARLTASPYRGTGGQPPAPALAVSQGRGRWSPG
jgi:hypothetical protein